MLRWGGRTSSPVATGEDVDIASAAATAATAPSTGMFERGEGGIDAAGVLAGSTRAPDNGGGPITAEVGVAISGVALAKGALSASSIFNAISSSGFGLEGPGAPAAATGAGIGGVGCMTGEDAGGAGRTGAASGRGGWEAATGWTGAGLGAAATLSATGDGEKG